ncbi:MAG: putative capsular polysaccharide synthesis family protein [Thermodesulfobacteriota bacterium]
MKPFPVQLIPNFMLEILFRFQAGSIHFRNFDRKPPILIYQMGKVGSSTVHHSLEKAGLGRPIYHIHFLDREHIDGIVRTYYRTSGVLRPKHLFISLALAPKLSGKHAGRLKVITLVRDPIARALSDVFENAALFNGGRLIQEGRFQETAIRSHLENTLTRFDERTDYACTWFDREIRKVLHLDVYAYPFDYQAGFTLIHKDKVDLLILQLESLSKTFEPAMGRFLNTTRPIPLLNTNTGEAKAYASQYQRMKESFRLPENICRKIYGSKYCRHFYNQNAIDRFIQKWSRPDGDQNSPGC